MSTFSNSPDWTTEGNLTVTKFQYKSNDTYHKMLNYNMPHALTLNCLLVSNTESVSSQLKLLSRPYLKALKLKYEI